MLRQLSMLAALIMSSGLISMGHGALTALVVQQGGIYGFSDTFLGLLITITYVGFVAGNSVFRWLLPRISYIRTFSVCAAVLASGALLLPILPQEAAWMMLRFGHGLFFSTAVVICESWLNTTVDNQHRGKVHATYMTVNYIAFGASQYILLLGSDDVFLAFSLAAIFIIMSLAPICLTRFAEPQFGSSSGGGMSIADAYRIAPIAYLAQLGNGIFTGATWLFVRYAEAVAGAGNAASTLAVVFFGSGFLLQLPIGWLSDRVRDRRNVMIAVYALSALLALLLFLGDYFSSGILMVIVLLFGMISATGFSLNIAYGQDFAGREQASEYASRLFQPFAFGAIAGPLAAGLLMDSFSAVWLFLFIGVVCGSIAAVTFTGRIMPRVVPAKQSAYQVVSSHTPTVGQDIPQYNELDIGPAAPEALADAADEAQGADFVGPQQAEDFNPSPSSPDAGGRLGNDDTA